jgi:protein-disulfide isomerase
LSFHDQAQKAAEASLCARDQKGDAGFWAMHNKLFENQGSLSVANEKLWARSIGVDGAKFDICLDSGKFAAQVASEESYGQSLGVSGTPAFFINGIPLTGAQPFSAFQKIIESELAK